MSMGTWMNEAQPFPNNENGGFNTGDPSMGFMSTPTSSSFEFNQMQNQQLQQRMQNGNMRNGSPGFHNPMYPTQAVIPSKRPRPREDSLGASPQQHPGTLPASRSQTPQGPYPGFSGVVNGGHQFTGPTPYTQFPQTQTNSNHSPSVPGQSYNAQAPQQRLSTVSPSPFSPAAQNLGGQTSPSQSEHGSRVNTPQNGSQQYPSNVSYGGPPNQTFTPPPGANVNGSAALAQYTQTLQRQQQAQRINETRIRQMQQFQQQGSAMNPSAQMPNQLSPQQVAAMQARQGQQTQSHPEVLLRNITMFNQQNGVPFNPSPLILGKPISGVHLFLGVMKIGGSKRIAISGQWPNLAQSFRFPPPQVMAAAQELSHYWQSNLAAYEQHVLAQQQRRSMADTMRGPGYSQGSEITSRSGMFSPTKHMHNQHNQQPMQPPPSTPNQFQTPTKHMGNQLSDGRPMMQNDYIVTHQAQAQGRPSSIYSTPQNSMQAPPRASQSQEGPQPGPSKDEKKQQKLLRDVWPKVDGKNLIEDPLEPRTYVRQTDSQHYGGLQLDSWEDKKLASHFINTAEDLSGWKPTVPRLDELGMIDIRTLNLSLQSGLHAEVRYALDTLASVSRERHMCLLENCEDLLDSLIDCADDQLQLLAENSAEVSDAMLINSYEETTRGCKVENMTLQDVPQFGTIEYDLDKAVERLICISTILRNMSFEEPNQPFLADPTVIRFMTTVIRYIGTRSMLLRTHQNTLDFSKDVLIFLANVSHHIDLAGKEEALCIMHFLISFAPSPSPNSGEDGAVTFSSYIPGIHRYYPHAIDSLAKLLARDDPNRTIYRSIFAADSASIPQYDLLTRAFGLAIASMPEAGNPHMLSVIRARASYLLQSLLSAEILTSLIPSTEHELARSWLTSQDGFSISLLRIVSELGKQLPVQPTRDNRTRQIVDIDPTGMIGITERGFSLLRKLIERARDADGSITGLPLGVLPDKRSVVAALAQRFPDHVPPDYPTNTIRQLCALSNLDT